MPTNLSNLLTFTSLFPADYVPTVASDKVSIVIWRADQQARRETQESHVAAVACIGERGNPLCGEVDKW